MGISARVFSGSRRAHHSTESKGPEKTPSQKVLFIPTERLAAQAEGKEWNDVGKKAFSNDVRNSKSNGEVPILRS